MCFGKAHVPHVHTASMADPVANALGGDALLAKLFSPFPPLTAEAARATPLNAMPLGSDGVQRYPQENEKALVELADIAIVGANERLDQFGNSLARFLGDYARVASDLLVEIQVRVERIVELEDRIVELEEENDDLRQGIAALQSELRQADQMEARA